MDVGTALDRGTMRTRTVRNCTYRVRVAIARFPSIVIDCPDPGALATFYGTMLDWKVDTSPPGWVEIRADYGQCISFQPVESYTPPRNRQAQDVPQCT